MKLLIPLDKLLDIFTVSVYDKMHGFGPRQWTLDANEVLDQISEVMGLSKDEMGSLLDKARQRVYGV